MSKIALVTGSSRGIGRATALRLADEGFDVAVNYMGSEKKASGVVDEIGAKRRKALAVKADVSRWLESKQLIEKAVKRFGKIDVLVNNAGIYERTVLDNLSPDEWNRRLATNLSSVFCCTKAALPHLKKNGWGRVINISSQI